MLRRCFTVAVLCVPLFAFGQELEVKPDAPYFKRFYPEKATAPRTLQLREGDRLALCGDSITEQKMYSRIIETYLTVCTPQLKIDVRQFGWSGEKANGFYGRMDSDVLRFQPTIATTCYGMNDHQYRSFRREIGDEYRTYMTKIVERFQQAGTRMIVGSPGSVGKRPDWGWNASIGTDREDLNMSLCELRNIGLQVAKSHNAGFADVFWPMILAGEEAKQRYGVGYMLEGNDGVHPDWAGHVLMAYAFLKSFGLDGNIGQLTYDFAHHTAKGSAGHEATVGADGTMTVVSTRYPFCAPEGPLDSIGSFQSAFSLVPFHNNFNRYVLRVSNAPKSGLRVVWGDQSKTFARSELNAGINLAAEFPVNPFCKAFRAVDEAVYRKQAFETEQIKREMHSTRDAEKLTEIANITDVQRQRLKAAIESAFVPVAHTLRFELVK